ncbi:MAG: DUF3574 domain-containing protein [Vicinamibacterales bacterium]
MTAPALAQPLHRPQWPVVVLSAVFVLMLAYVVLRHVAPAAARVDGGPPGVALSSGASHCPDHVQARLFFGLATPQGTVSGAEWARFLAEIITPRFPGGFTVVHADGQWRARGRNDVLQEPARVVEIVDHGGPTMDRRLSEIVAIYRERFRQESVMLTREHLEVCF